jgi:RHS repeat-associated protein
MTALPHLPNMEWDFDDQLQHVDLAGGGDAYYVYDATGQRIRKVVEKNGGALIEERLYLGGFEIFRRRNASGTVTLERETLHIMDDQQRIALVETRTQGSELGVPAQLMRYQYGNHLGSAILELDGQGQIISYEEYYPYGSTSYQAGRSAAEVSRKRYRYTGMERDEESGLNYHGARYYAPWLGRWASCDPLGLKQEPNLYTYCAANPVNRTDMAGTDWEFCNPFSDKDCGLSSTLSVAKEVVKEEVVPRVAGGLKAGTGYMISSVNCPLVEIGIGIPGCVYGIDLTTTGLKQIWTGDDESTATYRLISHLSSERDARELETVLTMGMLQATPSMSYRPNAPTPTPKTERNVNPPKPTAKAQVTNPRGGNKGPEPSVLKTDPKSLPNTTPKPSSANPQIVAPRTTPISSPAPWNLTELMTGTQYKPTQNVIYFGTVEKMAQAMRNNSFNWRGMDDPIIVDTRGTILQGHHRIVAARLARQPIPKDAIQTVPETTGRDRRPWRSVTLMPGEKPQ